jgi:opacity protein-like surface antigen
MRFRSIAVCSCIIVALFAAHPARGIDVRVTGGYTHVAYGDFNDFADGINAIIAADPEISGEFGNINWIPEIGAELSMPLMHRLSLSAGAGLLWGTSEFTFSSGGAILSFEHAIKAYPLTAALYAEIPAPFAFAKPYAYAGGGAYYTKLTFEERAGAGGDITGYDADLTSWGFGMHGGLGLAVSVTPLVSIDFGFKGRYVKIKHFEGTATSTEGETVDVVLGFYEGEGGYMVYGPVGAAYAGAVDQGTVDLTGYAITAGVNVSF